MTRLEGQNGEETSHDSAEADGGTASTVEGGGGRGSGGGSAGRGNSQRGTLQGAAGGGDVGNTAAAGNGSSGDGDNGAGSGRLLGALGGSDDDALNLGRVRGSNGAGGGNGSNGSGGGLILGAVSGGNVVNDSHDGVLGGSRGGGRGSSLALRAVGSGHVLDDGDSGLSARARASGSGGGSTRAGARALGDTELGGPLVSTGALDDDQETIVGGVGGQVVAGGPGVVTSVVDVLNDSLEGLHVGRRAAQKDQGDLVTESRVPLDLVGSTLRDLVVQTGSANSIALGALGVVGLGEGRSEGDERGDDSTSGETHGDLGKILEAVEAKNDLSWEKNWKSDKTL